MDQFHCYYLVEILLGRKVGYIPETNIGRTLHFGNRIKSRKDKDRWARSKKDISGIIPKDQKPMKKLRNQRPGTMSSSTEYNI